MVRLAVPLRVQAGVFQPEVGGEIDDVFDLAPQLWHQLLRLAVGQPEEHDVETFRAAGVGGLEAPLPVGRREARVQVGDALPGLGIGGRQFEGQLGMPSDDPQQFCTRVAGCSDDPDPQHATTIHPNA